jgi:hypothetical protein
MICLSSSFGLAKIISEQHNQSEKVMIMTRRELAVAVISICGTVAIFCRDGKQLTGHHGFVRLRVEND